MNCLIKRMLFLLPVALSGGCGDKTDQTLSPPDEARYVRVLFRQPEGITLMPMQVLYRSEKCMDKSYNSSFESYPVRGYNGFTQPFTRQGQSNIWQTSIAIDGGGPCQWQLNSLRVSFRIAEDNPLVKGKEAIDTSYIFDFDDYGFSDGYGTGRAKAFSGKQLDVKTDFFPLIYISHMFNKTTFKLFGGDTDYEKWSRRYRLKNTRFITIEPIFHAEKKVTLEADKQRGVGMVITYPGGDEDHVRKINPDYQKLLSSMK